MSTSQGVATKNRRGIEIAQDETARTQRRVSCCYLGLFGCLFFFFLSVFSYVFCFPFSIRPFVSGDKSSATKYGHRLDNKLKKNLKLGDDNELKEMFPKNRTKPKEKKLKKK